MAIKLSVIIPAFNEEKNLRKGALEKVNEFLKSQNYSYEVLIVDDGSKDKTADLVEDFIKNKSHYRLIKNSHAGKALTVMTGLQESKGEIALFTDMDQATPLNQIDKFFPQFNKGFDIVIGSRQGREGAPMVRKLSAWGFSVLRNLILGLPFADTQCGFKAFDKKAITDIVPILMEKWQHMKAHGGAVNAGFDIEMLFLAKKKDLKIAEVPVEWHYVDTERVQVVKDAYEAIKDMFRIRLNDLSGKYGSL